MELLAQESHTGEHLLGVGFYGVATQMVISVVEVGKLLGQLGVFVGFVVGALGQLVGDALHLPFHILDFGKGGDGLVPHRQRGVARELLRQVAHAMAGGDDHRARSRLNVAMDDLQQRGFPRAVVPHQTDSVTIARNEGDVLEEEVPGKIHRKFVYLYHLVLTIIGVGRINYPLVLRPLFHRLFIVFHRFFIAFSSPQHFQRILFLVLQI